MPLNMDLFEEKKDVPNRHIFEQRANNDLECYRFGVQSKKYTIEVVICTACKPLQILRSGAKI